MKPLRIISWNLQKGYRQEELEAQFPRILALEPDFLCLQEVMWEASVVIDRALLHMDGRYRLIQEPITTYRGSALGMTAIMARSDWDTDRTEFVRFREKIERENAKGLMVGVFTRGEESITIASIHQPAQALSHVRRATARIVRDYFADKHGPTVVCGDFNTGLPGENPSIARILSDKFEWLTAHVGPTCYWRRLETTFNTWGRIGHWIGRYLDIRLPIDHAYATRDLVGSYDISARKLPEYEASDHLPVVIDFVPRP